MNVVEFRAALERDEANLRQGRAPAGVMVCAECDVPLQETLTGNRKCGDAHLCSDCYFESLGRELDAHPIGALRILRGA